MPKTSLQNISNRLVNNGCYLNPLPKQAFDKPKSQPAKVLRLYNRYDSSVPGIDRFSSSFPKKDEPRDSKTSLVLSQQELAELTDKKHSKKQMQELDYMDIPYWVTSQGKVKVLRDQLNNSAAEDSSEPDTSPNYEALTLT